MYVHCLWLFLMVSKSIVFFNNYPTFLNFKLFFVFLFYYTSFNVQIKISMKTTKLAYRGILAIEQNSIVGDNDFTIKLPELSVGIYFLKVNNPNGQVITKLVKQ